MTTEQRFLVSAYGTGTNLAPLVHSEEKLGNKVFFRRLSIKSGDEVVSAPVLSGNSFRGAWRDLAALDLVEKLEIKQLSQLAFVTLFSGGTLTSGSANADALAQSLYQNLPNLSLLGFSMGSKMYASRVGVDFAVPVTNETLDYARAAYPELTDDQLGESVPASQITGMSMLTRKKDEEKASLVDLTIEEDDEDASPTQMLFHVEYVVPNTTFVHGFRTVYPVSPLEFGALLKVLELSGQRSYGGQGSRGFGRMNWEYTITWRTSLDDTEPGSGKLRLGQESHIDKSLDEFKSGYEKYVNTELRTAIEDDSNLNKIIQMALEGNEDEGE